MKILVSETGGFPAELDCTESTELRLKLRFEITQDVPYALETPILPFFQNFRLPG